MHVSYKPIIITPPAFGRRRWLAGLAAAVLLAILCGLARYQVSLPAAQGAGAPDTEFSAARAIRHVDWIARAPHPPGTAAHRAVQQYILNELSVAGLAPQVQEVTVPVGRGATTVAYATLQNIVARLPGTEPGGKALVLAAHYDSVPTGPGASDDGAGVAALLETMRALQAGEPLQNDVIFLITDGEEMGLLGARGFVKEHPWAQEAGLILNFEMRGTGGQALMFEVSNGNGALMQEFAQAVPYPATTALAYEIYRRMPNDTDISVFKELQDVAYFNVAAVGNGQYYHTRLDNLANTDRQTLQHMGSYALGVARHFGNQPLPPARTGDAVWFNGFRWWLVRYPATWALPLALAAAVALLLVLAFGFRWRVLTLKAAAAGLMALPAALVLMVGIITAFMRWGGQASWPELLTPAYMALAGALVLGVYGVWRRWAGTGALLAGALLWWAIFAVATACLLPGGSYLFTWPLLFALPGFAYLLLVGEERAEGVRGLAIMSVCLAPAFLLAFSMTGTFYEALSYLPQVATALVMLVFGLCAAQAGALLRAFRGWLPLGVLVVSVGLAVGAVALPNNAAHPGRDTLWYGWDAGTGKGWWLARTQDAWTNPYVGGVAYQDQAKDFFPLGGYYYRAPAEAINLSLPAPKVEVLSDTEAYGDRTLRLRLSSPRGAGLIGLYTEPGVQVKEARVAGRPSPTGDKPWSMLWVAPPAEGVEVEFRLPVGQPFAFRLIDGSLGLPQGTAPRPESLMPGRYGVDWLVPSDSTLVSQKFSL